MKEINNKSDSILKNTSDNISNYDKTILNEISNSYEKNLIYHLNMKINHLITILIVKNKY